MLPVCSSDTRELPKKELDKYRLSKVCLRYPVAIGTSELPDSQGGALMFVKAIGRIPWSREGTRSLSVKDGKYRVVLPDRHYDLVRRYMVVKRLPSARAAVMEMIEAAIVANGKEQFLIEELESSPTERRRGRVMA